jgi:hypothetical protein
VTYQPIKLCNRLSDGGRLGCDDPLCLVISKFLIRSATFQTSSCQNVLIRLSESYYRINPIRRIIKGNHVEIKCRLKAGNSCYFPVQTLLSSRLLSKNLKIKIYKTIILPVVLHGCETRSLILREERRLRVLTRIFWFQKD